MGVCDPVGNVPFPPDPLLLGLPPGLPETEVDAPGTPVPAPDPEPDPEPDGNPPGKPVVPGPDPDPERDDVPVPVPVGDAVLVAFPLTVPGRNDVDALSAAQLAVNSLYETHVAPPGGEPSSAWQLPYPMTPASQRPMMGPSTQKLSLRVQVWPGVGVG